MPQATTLPLPHVEHRPRTRPGLAARRFGYTVAIAVNLLMFFLLNESPGWDAVPFLSAETTEVLGWVNASILLAVGANLLYVVHDPPWLRPLGDAVTTSFGIIVMVRIWQVFPFTEDVTTTGWGDLFHVLLAVGIAGSVIGVVNGLVCSVRALPGR